MKTNFQELQVSERIQTIIQFFEQVIKDYDWSYEQVNKLDKETQDILHSLELEKLTTGERNKLTTRIIKLRKERRKHKDIAEELEPIVSFIQTDKGRALLHPMKEALGKTRKVEAYHQKRQYHKRVKEAD